MDKDKDLEKLVMLMRAMDDTAEAPEWEQELREGAWLILHNEPGLSFEQWRQELLEQYPTEVVDTFGPDPDEAYKIIAQWWETEQYEDRNTHMRKAYKDWAEIFANEKTVEVYDEHAKLKIQLKRNRK